MYFGTHDCGYIELRNKPKYAVCLTPPFKSTKDYLNRCHFYPSGHVPTYTLGDFTNKVNLDMLELKAQIGLD